MGHRAPLLRYLFSLGLLALIVGGSSAATVPVRPASDGSPWPQVPPIASYRIAVTLDPTTHTLTGEEVLTYRNPTSDTLSALVFHLYLNAFRDDQTTWMREALSVPPFLTKHPGWIEVTRLTTEAGEDLLALSRVEETLLTTTLPQPLLPGEAITLSLSFEAQLPRVVMRTGFFEEIHLVAQWFPKLAVYRPGRGWNAHQFHANSEFFADVGTYDVAITTPAEQVVVANGLPAGREEHPDGTVTHRFHAEAVIDFVWVAGPQWQQARRQVGPLEVLLVYPPDHADLVERYLEVAAASLLAYGEWYGPYPYPRLTIVDLPPGSLGAGGMEYPGLVMVDPTGGMPAIPNAHMLEFVTAHEIAHQWWQSVVATNEFEEPWMDEGLAEYSAGRLMDALYGEAGLVALGSLTLSARDLDRSIYLLFGPGVPMAGRAWEFDPMSYQVATYSKPATVYTTMERLLGKERWLQILRTYYERYRFRHPTGEDFLAVIEEVAGAEARTWLEAFVYGKGLVDYAATGLECTPLGEEYRCTATVSRLGEVALPVEVELTFADGGRRRERWDGVERKKEFSTAGPELLAVEVDPERVLFIDCSFYNNSLTRLVQVVPLLRISGQWLYWMESVILTLGGWW